MTPKDAQTAARRLAKRQHWVITRGQLLALGFTTDAIRHRVEIGRLHPTWRGVYAIGRSELTQEGVFIAAVLACGPGAVLSHLSAAALWGLVKVAWPVQVSVPLGRTPRRTGIKVHRRATTDPTRHRNIPVTSPTQTLLDIACQLNGTQYERAVNEAINRDLVDPDVLRPELDQIGPRAGVSPLRRLLDRHTHVLTDTELEQRFVPIARRAGLPRPQTQAWVNGHRVDFYFPDLKLVVEADSLRFHRTPSQQAKDRLRDQAHTVAGLTPLRFTHAQITFDPAYVEATLSALSSRGPSSPARR
jgi:very-short-patch-repair endonuclease